MKFQIDGTGSYLISIVGFDGAIREQLKFIKTLHIWPLYRPYSSTRTIISRNARYGVRQFVFFGAIAGVFLTFMYSRIAKNNSKTVEIERDQFLFGYKNLASIKNSILKKK